MGGGFGGRLVVWWRGSLHVEEGVVVGANGVNFLWMQKGTSWEVIYRFGSLSLWL